MLGQTQQKSSLALEAPSDQVASSQDVASQGNSRFLWTGLGFAGLMLIGISACSLAPIASHPSPAVAVIPTQDDAFIPANPLPALIPGDTRQATSGLRAPAAPGVSGMNMVVKPREIVPPSDYKSKERRQLPKPQEPKVPLEYASDPPGFFPTTFQKVAVKSVKQETSNSKIITFALPDGVSLNLPVSSCILMNIPRRTSYESVPAITTQKQVLGWKVPAFQANAPARVIGTDAKDLDGNGQDFFWEMGQKPNPLDLSTKEVARPYNPISSNSVTGSFDLLVKQYPGGAAARLFDNMKEGDLVAFKQVKPNIKAFQYPFGKAAITMVAGGTGIAPMIQALHPILNTEGDSTVVHLIYGNDSPDDIMLKAELDEMQAKHPEQLKVTYVVGKTATDDSAKKGPNGGWQGLTGWIDEAKLAQLAYPPGKDNVVWICGPDAMYDSLAGSRGAKLKDGSALVNLGYSEEMVWRS